MEVVGGTKTSPDAIQQALAFYAAIGKKPVYLKKELPGHVGNRLQAALYREVMYLIQQDVLSVEDADVAVSYGPGLRWGVMGPSLQWHLGGGAGGIKHFMDHLMDPLAGVIKSLGTPDITPELKQTIVEGVLREAATRSVIELAGEANELLIGLLRLRGQTENRASRGEPKRATLGGRNRSKRSFTGIQPFAKWQPSAYAIRNGAKLERRAWSSSRGKL